MAEVLDVAEMVLRDGGPTDTFRLQKLVYYAQACHLARRGEPLFSAPIRAWVHGPVVTELYQTHRGQYRVATVGGHPERLTAEQRGSVEAALRLYGAHDSDWLVDQTHAEPPWLEARRGLPPDATASPKINLETMRKHYSAILNDPEIEEALAEAEAEVGFSAAELRERYSA